ncbi:MAG: MarR family transcriptional regulator, partial [Acetobacteraceae bacterium]
MPYPALPHPAVTRPAVTRPAPAHSSVADPGATHHAVADPGVAHVGVARTKPGAPVGLASPREMRAKLSAAARGEHSLKDAPRLWMSVDALMRLLTPENRGLLAMIAAEKPRSVSDLAARSGRDQGNLSRTLDKLEQAGLVRLVADGREKRPE